MLTFGLGIIVGLIVAVVIAWFGAAIVVFSNFRNDWSGRRKSRKTEDLRDDLYRRDD